MFKIGVRHANAVPAVRHRQNRDIDRIARVQCLGGNHVSRPPEPQQLSAGQHCDLVCAREGLLRVVGREQYGQCSSLGKRTDGIENPHLVAEIEARSRLIEN